MWNDHLQIVFIKTNSLKNYKKMAQREETLDELLARIDREDARHYLEVKDVVREVDTPYATSDSDDDPIPLWDGEWDLARRLIGTSVIPTQPTTYTHLYEDEAYQRCARLKLEHVRGCFTIRTRQQITDLMNSERYRIQLAGLYQKYPEDGGRPDLYRLIAMYIIHLEDALQTTSSYDGNNDDNNNDNNDDDDDNGDDKENDKSKRKRKSSGDIMSRPFKTIRF